MDLTQVRLARVSRHSRAMLHGLAKVRIAFHTQPGEEPYGRDSRLAHGMHPAAAHRDHDAIHDLRSLSQALVPARLSSDLLVYYMLPAFRANHIRSESQQMAHLRRTRSAN